MDFPSNKQHHKIFASRRRAILTAIFWSTLLAPIYGAQVFAAAPVTVDDARKISRDSSITINIVANDYDPDGNSLFVVSVGSPTHGNAVLQPDGSVFYTPPSSFTGSDSFTYIIQEDTEEGLTAAGTVVIDVTSTNYSVYTNNDNNSNLAAAIDGVCAQLRSSSDSELGAARRNLLERCNQLDELAAGNPDGVGDLLDQFAPEETVTQMRVSGQSSRAQSNAVSQRLQQIKTGDNSFTLNGRASASGGAAGADGETWSRLGLFSSVQFDSAKRDITELENGYDANARSLTVGLDYQLSDQLILGSAVGFTTSELDYAQQNGGLESDIVSLIAFGSWYLDRYALDVQVGYADTSFDSQRHIHYDGMPGADDTVSGATDGQQWLANMQGQWTWNKNALTVYPFVRLDYLQSKTGGYVEQGDSGLAMMLGDQSMTQLTLSGGVQTTYAINTNWGVLVPTAQLTLLSDASSDYDPVVARFAYDPDPDNNFLIHSDGGDKSYAQLSVGTSAVFIHGVSAFVQYQQMFGYEKLQAFQVQAGIRYEF